MARPVRIKRRISGSNSAPASLINAEIAYNEVSDIFYIGKGLNGSNDPNGDPLSSTVKQIGGEGAFTTLNTPQTITEIKTFTASPLVPKPAANDNSGKVASTEFVNELVQNLGAGDMLKGIYDTNNSGAVDDSERLGGLLANLFAVLASPAFTGDPKAPTPILSNDSNSIATTAFVKLFITSLLGAVNGIAQLDAQQKVLASQLPAYVDDILEFANLAAFPATGETGKIYVALETNNTYRWSGSAYIKIVSGNVDTVFGRSGVIISQNGDYNTSQITNLSVLNGLTLTDSLNAINNLAAALRTMAFQDANNVNITGGTIDNIVIDGGSF